MEDRTPYEMVAGPKGQPMEGQELADYRSYKMAFHKNDPPFWICPKCEIVAVGHIDPEGTCLACRGKERDEQIRIWKEAEHKRNGTDAPKGGLADKVRAAEAKQQEPARAGAERAYPAEND